MCAGIFVFNVENPNMFAGKVPFIYKIGDVWPYSMGTPSPKVPTANTFFQWLPEKWGTQPMLDRIWVPTTILRLLSYFKTWAGSPKTFKVVKCTQLTHPVRYIGRAYKIYILFAPRTRGLEEKRVWEHTQKAKDSADFHRFCNPKKRSCKK